MKFSTCAAIALALTLASSAGVHAQPSASHAQAAEELLEAIEISKVMDRSIDVMLEAQLRADPKLAKIEDVLRQFMGKYLSLESLKPGMVKLYTEAFTEEELHELVAFYRTPLGKKTVTLMPELMEKGAILGQKAIQEHLPELQEAVAKKMKESSGSSEKP